MASSSLSSLLGLTPSPVIAPSAVDKRLSTIERRVATAAFHRARGYGDRIDFPRFRDTLLHEAFGAMPLYVTQRLFMVWNFAGSGNGSGGGASTSGALTLKEFLVGVTIAWKGSRDEHLKFAYQLMDRYGGQEVTKRDALAFLKAVATPLHGVVAVEAPPSGKTWTMDEFATLLFPTDKTLLASAKFLKIVTSRSFASLALIDWIPTLAVQFEREKEKLTRAVTPVTAKSPTAPTRATEEDSLMDSIMGKLRHINSGDSSSASTTSSTTWGSASSLPGKHENGISHTVDSNALEVIQIESMTADQFQSLKRALAELIWWALSSKEAVTDASIRDRLSIVVAPTVLNATQATADACVGDFLFSFPPSQNDSTAGDSFTGFRAQGKAKVLWWILCICCSLARSSAEVLRYLFVLFDEESQGYWTRRQLATFIRCVDFQEEEQSSQAEAAFLAQTVFDEIASTSQQSAAASETPSGDDPLAEDAPLFRFRDFEKYLARYPIAGGTSADIDVVFALFHADLAKHREQQLSHRTYLHALHSFCDQLIARELTTQLGFCLLHRSAWERLVEWMCDYDMALPLVNVLKSEVCTVVETCEASSDVISEAQSWEGYIAPPLVAVPISLWLVLATKLHERSNQATTQTSKWTETATQLTFSPPVSGGIDGGGPQHGSWDFSALVAAINLTVVARDGSECTIDIPHCIIDREITLQTLVQTVLSLHGRERASVQKGTSMIAAHPKGAFFCEGQVAFFGTNEKYQKIQVSQGVLLIALSTLDEGTRSHRMKIAMNVLLTDKRSNSHLPRWQSPMLASPASSQRSGASTPSSRTPKNSKRGATTGWTKVHGLANLGNTCFMNSALQCLAATPILREYFLRGEHLVDLSSHAVHSTKGSPLLPGKKTSPTGTVLRLPKSSLLPVAFGQLLAEMNAYSSNGSVSGMADVISPKYLKTAIATLFPHLSDGTQQDAQEFLSSLLSSLSDELKRLPILKGPQPPAQVASPSLVSRFTSFSRGNAPETSVLPQSRESILSQLRFQVNDSNGRCDSVVAKEWWISHLITEPSVITALFCGQFKSTLRCNQCGKTSTRFEPFSSLQLPLLDEAAMLSPRSKRQNQQIVVVLHFLDSPCQRPSLRIVVHVGLDWTVEQLLIKIQQDHATYSSMENRRDHIAVTLSGFTIDDYVDPEALLTSIPTPINVFEIEYGDQARAFGTDSFPRHDTFEVGAKVLARASHARWVKAVIERQGLPAPDASVSQSPVNTTPLTYYLSIEEAGMGARVCLGRSDIIPRITERFVLLRFLHRRHGLVPFYSTSPVRQVICGFPFLCRLPTSLICGRGLCHMVHRKFASADQPLSDAIHRRSFMLKRVRNDGKSCGLCHWTDHCDGCKIDRLAEEPLDLAMDETIAIDWSLDAHEPAEEWLASGCSIEDHTTYAAYRLDNTHSLEKSLQILCSEEHVEARCSHCTNTPPTPTDSPRTDQELGAYSSNAPPQPASFVPHTKTLALWSLPPILVIQLKRFELVAEGGYSYQRLNHSVDFDVDSFNMAAFLTPSPLEKKTESDRDDVARAESFLMKQLEFPTDTASRDITSYRLYGLVNHMGDLGGGHYTAHIRHPDNADWWLVDDASATPANPQTLSPSSSAYLLFYVREDLDPTPGDDDDYDLERELSNRPRGLSDFYPRQPHATPVADAVVRALCKQDFWQRRPTTKQDTKRDDGNCTLM